MINRKPIMSLILVVALLANVFGQDANDTTSLKTLKDAYAGKFLIGAANDLRGISEAELTSVKVQYDILTPENCMKPQPLHPSMNKYNFETTDKLVEWCQQNGVQVWGHTLAWHAQTPAWFFQAENPETDDDKPPTRPRWDPNAPRLTMAEYWRRSIKGEMASREVALERLESHIKTVVGRYKGQIIGWDVFNESNS